MKKSELQKEWEKVFPDSAAMEREVKRRWGLSYFDFLFLMNGKIKERRAGIIIQSVMLVFEAAILVIQLWLSMWLGRLIKLQ